jgi:hypothetical protein
MNRTEKRLQRMVDARLEAGETMIAWSPAWVSRYMRFHWLLSARNRDFAVVTDRRLMLWSAGFFTRQPRRRVLADRLDEITVESTSRDPGRQMACSRPGRRPLLIELGKDDRSDKFSIELRDRASAARARRGVRGPVTEPKPTLSPVNAGTNADANGDGSGPPPPTAHAVPTLATPPEPDEAPGAPGVRPWP